MRRLLGLIVLVLALLASACGDPFDCSVVQCDGLYQAEGEGETIEFLRFWGDGKVVWIPVMPTEAVPNVSVEAVATWLNKTYLEFSGGEYSIDGDTLVFSVGRWKPSTFEGEIQGDTLILTRQDLETGGREERVFEFVDIEVIE